jgi:hypothetical protein
MLLKHRSPGIDATSVQPRAGLEHLDRKSLAVLRWLNANHVDYVLVGPVAHAIRGDHAATGPVAIVPAPYSRNFERLCNALVAEHAGLRAEVGARGVAPGSGSIPVKLTAEKLARGKRWLLRFGSYDLDIEADGSHRDESDARSADHAPAPRYQELVYEAARVELADGLSVQAASPEDLEHYSHVRRTGEPPEFKVTRKAQTEHETA